MWPMDKQKLSELKAEAEQRLTDLFRQRDELITEIARTQGDYRTYEKLLNLADQEDPQDGEGQNV